ncbi:MAG TPA: PadR family transcriptional regulator [Acidobacteriota bacterium]|nr:PadR family transcriptional regulator [Acidobacteriota bacterium]
MNDKRETPIQDWLPLNPQVLAILLVLMDQDRHGYGIMQDAESLSGAEVQMQPGALYRHLKKLLEGGLVRELERQQVDPGSDERRRYYSITHLGREVAAAETERMERWIQLGKARRVLDQG